MSTILQKIRSNYGRVFRKLFIKRRSGSTGFFESSWVDISSDIKSWGRIRREIDSVQYSKVKFSDVMVRFENTSGRYNPSTDEASLWYNYADQQRTLVKIEAGFIHQTLSSSGIYTNTLLPSNPQVFFGIISGDILISDKNEVTVPVKPLLQVFRDFPARNLVGWTSTGLTATQFFQMVRDQTDGSSNYIFRPFFQETTTYWNIATTSNVYTNLNTSGAADVLDKTVWDVMEKLAEAEDLVTYVKNDGTLTFGTRTAGVSSTFHFVGTGFLNNEYGHTIKNIRSYGKKVSDYYSRVEVKWIDSNTITAIQVKENTFTVNGTNAGWVYGVRTFRFENFWIPTSTVATTILNNIFNNVATLKDRVEFTSSFVPHLEILNRIQVSYDSSQKGTFSRWDINDWCYDDTALANDLSWDVYSGDAIRLNQSEFKILSIDLDLDKLETNLVAISV